jgi:hypothetical protein
VKIRIPGQAVASSRIYKMSYAIFSIKYGNCSWVQASDMRDVSKHDKNIREKTNPLYQNFPDNMKLGWKQKN